MPTDEEPTQQVAQQIKNENALLDGTGFSTAGGTVDDLTQQFSGHVSGRQGQQMTLDGDTQFELASVTKTFTALLYLYALQTEQVVNATDPISKWIPDLASTGLLGGLLLKSLVNYTSGLPDDNMGNPGVFPEGQTYPYDVTKMLTFLTNNATSINTMITAQLAKPDVYAYSNLGFALLGVAVANALNSNSTNDLAGALQSVIFASSGIGMPNSFLFSPAQASLPQGLDKQGKAVPEGNPLFPSNWGGGGIVSTGNDMVQYLSFLMGMLPNSALKPLLPLLFKKTWTSPGISAGWFINTMKSSNGKPDITFYQKNGALSGFSSWIGITLEPKVTGQFVLCNQNGKASDKGLALLRALNGYEQEPSAGRSPEELEPSEEE